MHRGLLPILLVLFVVGCGGSGASSSRPPAASPTASPSPSDRLIAEVNAQWGKNWQTVIDRLLQLRKLQPDEAEWGDKLYAAYVALGTQLVQRKDYPKAREAFAQAVALDPERPEAMTAAATIPEPTARPEPTPSTAATIAELPRFLETKLPPEGRGTAFVIDDVPATLFALKDGFALNTMAKTYARDFIFSAYATGLPIRGAQITVMQPNGKLGLAVVLGANVAARSPATTWTNRSIGPTVFINQMKEWSVVGHVFEGPDRASVSGPYAD